MDGKGRFTGLGGGEAAPEVPMRAARGRAGKRARGQEGARARGRAPSWESGGTRGYIPGEPGCAAILTQYLNNESKNPISKA